MSRVIVFQDPKKDGDGYIQVDEKVFHKIMDAEARHLYYTWDVDSTRDVFSTCKLDNDVVQYLIQEEVWDQMSNIIIEASSRMFGYNSNDKYYLKRNTCDYYSKYFKKNELNGKRRALVY